MQAPVLISITFPFTSRRVRGTLDSRIGVRKRAPDTSPGPWVTYLISGNKVGAYHSIQGLSNKPPEKRFGCRKR